MIGQPVFFIHIPKTAGTSVRSLLRRVSGARRMVEMPLQSKGRAAAAGRLGLQDVVVGHVGYGLVEYFPSKPFAFTFLRDPIARSLSNFSFLQQAATVPGVAEDADDFAVARRMTLAEFVSTEPVVASRHIGNLHVWFLTRDGIDPRRDLRDLTRSDLEAAKRNLEKLDLIGLVERMAESVLMLFSGLRCSPTLLGQIPVENTLATRLCPGEIDSGTMSLLMESCSLDLELYEHGVELFRQRARGLLSIVSSWLKETEADRAGSGSSALIAMLLDEACCVDHDHQILRVALLQQQERRSRLDAAAKDAVSRIAAIEASKVWRAAQWLRGCVGRRW